MANYCQDFMIIKRLDWWKLTEEEIWAFLRKPDLIKPVWIKVDWLDDMNFSYQYVVPIEQDENRWDNNINWWWCKWDWAYECYATLDDHEITLSFDTPWCPPDKWCMAVCKKFPELYIWLEYDEPGCEFQWEMWRNEQWELFDNYREWDEYLHTCNWCDIHYEDWQVKWRDDADEYLCDKCYKEFLDNKK